MKPYLVQRAKICTPAEAELRKEYKKGIDQLIDIDYMGSSEFEWGALPKALKRIRENFDSYTIIDSLRIDCREVTIFCKVEQKEEVLEAVRGLADHKYRLKEFCDFEHLVNGEDNVRNNFWWDIDNDFMFWITDKEFTKDFIEALKEKKS